MELIATVIGPATSTPATANTGSIAPPLFLRYLINHCLASAWCSEVRDYIGVVKIYSYDAAALLFELIFCRPFRSRNGSMSPVMSGALRTSRIYNHPH
jgi:hypothetical protein